MVLVDSKADQPDCRVDHVRPKVDLVKVGLVDHMVAPVDQRQGPIELKVVPMRVFLEIHMFAQVR